MRLQKLKVYSSKIIKEHVYFLIFVISFGILLGISFEYLDSLFVWGNGEFDDNLMYYILVKRFWQCFFPTFDCINPATGFHPLNFLVYAILYKLSIVTNIRFYYLTTIVYTILFLVSGLFIFKIIKFLLKEKEISYKKYVFYIPFIFLVNYFTLNTIIDGFDSVLSLLFLSVYVYYYLKIQNNISLRRYTILGFLGVLLFLSRTDLIIFIFIFSLYEFIIPKKFKEFMYYVLGFFPLFLVYVLFNYFFTSSFLQGSLLAKLMLSNIYHYSFHARFKMLPVQIYYIISVPLRILFSNITFDKIFTNNLTIKSAIIFGILIDLMFYLLLLYALFKSINYRQNRLVYMAITTLIAYILFYSLLGLGVRPWYFLIYNFLLLIISLFLLSRLSFRSISKFLFLITFLVYVQNVYMTYMFSIESKWSISMVNKELESLLKNVKECKYIFCFDKCGIIGYFFDNKGIISINLDGKLNSNVLYYIKDRRLSDYVCSIVNQNNNTCPVIFNILLPEKLGVRDFELINKTRFFEAIKVNCKNIKN